MTYKQVRAAFEGFQALDLIEITKEGHFDHIRIEGSLTGYVAKDELRERLQKLNGNPAFSIKPDVDKETTIYEIRLMAIKTLLPITSQRQMSTGKT